MKRKKLKFLLAVLLGNIIVCSDIYADIEAIVDANVKTGPMYVFWHSTGFAKTNGREPNYQYQNSIPFENMVYVRPHGLMSKVVATPSNDGSFEWDFSSLDQEIDKMIRNEQKPILEIMGKPKTNTGELLYDGRDEYMVQYKMVKALAKHYIQKYGKDEVRSWLFQNTNEPKVDEGFLKHFDACSQGFYEVDSLLRFGGPGSKDYQTDGVYKLMEHCINGTNYITKQKGTRIAWYSIHTKMETNEAVSLEAEVISNVREKFPQYANLPFLNDEGDRKCCYRHSYWWHSNYAYGTWMAEMVNQRVVRIIDSLQAPFMIWSNDFDFKTGWKQRSQFVGKNAEIVKKPCHNAIVMFSLLGDERIKVEDEPEIHTGRGILPTIRNDEQIAVIVYNSAKSTEKNEFIPDAQSSDEKVKLTINNIPFTEGAFVHYRFDSLHTNPYRIEVENSKLPEGEKLSDSDLEILMRERMELEFVEMPKIIQFENRSFTIDLDMPMNSSSMILLTKKPENTPPPVENIRFDVTSVSNRNGTQNTMIMWDEIPTRTVLTYEVYFSETEEGPFERVNKSNFFTTAYAHINTPPGFYKVQAVDYWGRVSEGGTPVGIGNLNNSLKTVIPNGKEKIKFSGQGQMQIKEDNSLFDFQGKMK